MGDVADYSIQPRPVAVDGAVSIHDLVIADLRALHLPGDYVAAGVQAIQERKDFGLRKYGVVLHAANERNYFKDADDEAGDLPVYLRAIMEAYPELADRLRPDYDAALAVMLNVRALLLERAS